MTQRLFIGSGLFLLAVAVFAPGRARSTAAESAGAGQEMVRTASALFDSLDEKEREKALFEQGSPERTRWHFIPRDRKGLPLKEMSESKREKTAALLKASLSEKGAMLAQSVMAHEDILRAIEGEKRAFPRDPLLYYVSFFGRPIADAPWGWRLEGHHLSLNFTLRGNRVVSATPIVYGANPAIVRDGPMKGLRLLGSIEDMGRQLVSSLAPEDQKTCLGEGGALEKELEEVPAPETARYSGPLPKGLSARKLSADSRRALAALIQEYTRNLPPDARIELNDERMDGVEIAWRGSLEPFKEHSYLIRGADFMINYINRQNGAAHVHSCYRNLRGDFGLPAESPVR